MKPDNLVYLKHAQNTASKKMLATQNTVANWLFTLLITWLKLWLAGTPSIMREDYHISLSQENIKVQTSKYGFY